MENYFKGKKWKLKVSNQGKVELRKKGEKLTKKDYMCSENKKGLQQPIKDNRFFTEYVDG